MHEMNDVIRRPSRLQALAELGASAQSSAEARDRIAPSSTSDDARAPWAGDRPGMLTVIAILWFLIWVFVVVDIVRRPQFTPLKKVAWALLALIFPVVGVIAYLIVRPPDTSDRYGRASDAEPEERMRGSHPV